jgi:hypothetical protein
LESQIIDATAAGDHHNHGWQRLEALGQQALFAPAQYYEVPYWSNFYCQPNRGL